MGKWNCVGCGKNLEDCRQEARFPLDDITLYCRDCARKLKTEILKCLNCGFPIKAEKSVQGKFCSRHCETDYYAKMATRDNLV